MSVPPKKSLMNYGIDFLRALLGEDKSKESEKPAAGQEPRFEDLKEGDLRQELARLQVEEDKIDRKLAEIKDKKAALFNEAVDNPGEVTEERNWRRTQELEAEALSYQHLQDVLTKRRRIVNGLIRLKERARMLQSPVFNEMPLTALVPMIEEAAKEGDVGEAQLDEVIKTIDGSYVPARKKAAEDPARAEWLRAVQEARLKTVSAPEAGDKDLSGLNPAGPETQAH